MVSSHYFPNVTLDLLNLGISVTMVSRIHQANHHFNKLLVFLVLRNLCVLACEFLLFEKLWALLKLGLKYVTSILGPSLI